MRAPRQKTDYWCVLAFEHVGMQQAVQDDDRSAPEAERGEQEIGQAKVQHALIGPQSHDAQSQAGPDGKAQNDHDDALGCHRDVLPLRRMAEIVV